MPGLPLVWNALLSLCAIALGAWIGTRAHRRKPVSDATHVLRHSPHLWLVVGLPLALLAYHSMFVIRPDWEWHLPYPVQYYYGPVAWGILIGCLSYFAGFGGAVFLETRHPRRFTLGAAMALLLVALQQFHWRTSTREAPEVGRSVVTREGHTYQTGPATCVPAATATLLAVIGEPRSEAELVTLMGTDVDGTLPSQLVMAMRRLGYRETTVKLDGGDVGAIPTPAVVFLRNNAHSVTLLELTERAALVWNPEPPRPDGSPGGRLMIDRTAFSRYFAGAHAISFSRKIPAGPRDGTAQHSGF